MSLLFAVLATAISTPAPAPIFEAPPRAGFDLSAPTFAPPAVEDPPPDLGKWKGSVTAGGTFASGNTERTSFAVTGKAEKRREKDRTSLDLLWNKTNEDGTSSEVRTIASAKYDYFASEKVFYYGQTSAENNTEANLHVRWTLGGGAGYQFLEDEKWKVSGEGGLSWVEENYDGNADDEEYPAARLAYKADYKANGVWEIGQATEVFPSLEDKDDVYAKVDTHAKVTLSKSLIGQLQWLYTWDNTPATGADRVDNLVLLTLGWTF